jgi:hypothetical protein
MWQKTEGNRKGALRILDLKSNLSKKRATGHGGFLSLGQAIPENQGTTAKGVQVERCRVIGPVKRASLY